MPHGGGFEARYSGLDTAASDAQDAGSDARSIDLAAALASLTSGLPGTRSAGAAASLGASWTRVLGLWADDTQEHGRSVTESRRTYQQCDTAATGPIDAAMPGEPGPRLPGFEAR